MNTIRTTDTHNSKDEVTIRMATLDKELFSKQTSLYDCFPGGNDTFMVMNTAFEREHYPRINQRILERYPKFEQGAVLEKSSKGGVLRMQMTGGEFCGNAARSAAALIAETYTYDQALTPVANYSVIKNDGGILSFTLEVSGTESLISTRVAPAHGGWDVEIELPRMAQRRVDSDIPLELGGQTVPCTVVTLEGISHILIPENTMPFVNDQETLQTLVADAISQLGWSELGAFGLIWMRDEGGQVAIEPVVYVKAIQTCIYESACGSGAIAVALASTNPGQTRATSVRQPSGAVLEAFIDQSDSAMGIAAKLRGPVEIRGDLNDQVTPKVANA
jgi:histidine racemase